MVPILLENPKITRASDDAGILISKAVLPCYTPGPYTPDLLPDHLAAPAELQYVPPLEYFCIKPFIQNVDLIDLGSCPRIPYRPELHVPVLKGFMTFFHQEMHEQDMIFIDPRIWAALVQIYSALPECFETYTLPLSDTHLTILQGIRSTADFTIITVLDLASRPEMSDSTIGMLKPLTNLCVLDLSGTKVGSWGVRKLSMCLTGSGSARSGPWIIRVWTLRGCRGVDDSVKDSLCKFPLLSVIDLRDTSVNPCSTVTGFSSNPPASHNRVYYPNPPLTWIPAILELFPQAQLFKADTQHSRPHILHINKLSHSESVLLRTRCALLSRQHIGSQDSVAMLLPDGGQAVNTAHGLVQDAKQKELRWKEELLRRRDVWQGQRTYGQSLGHRWYDLDKSDYDLDQSDYDLDQSDYDLDQSDYDLDQSDYDLDQSDDDAEQLDIGNMAGPSFDNTGPDDEIFTLSWQQERLAQNEVAGLISSREAAEHETRRFYAMSALERLEKNFGPRSGAVPNEMHLVATDDEHRMPGQLDQWPREHEGSKRGGRKRKPLTSVAEENCPRQLMFFRVPPSFDSIPSGQNVGSFKRKHEDKVVSVKKRNGTVIISDPSILLQNRKRMSIQTSRTEEQEDGDIIRYSASSLSRRTGFVPRERCNEDPHPPLVSMNPFLAKSRVLLECLNPTDETNIDVLSSTSSSRSSGTTANKPRSRSRTHGIGPQVAEDRDHSNTEKTSRESSGATKVPRAFDMKAWATQRRK